MPLPTHLFHPVYLAEWEAGKQDINITKQRGQGLSSTKRSRNQNHFLRLRTFFLFEVQSLYYHPFPYSGTLKIRSFLYNSKYDPRNTWVRAGARSLMPGIRVKSLMCPLPCDLKGDTTGVVMGFVIFWGSKYTVFQLYYEETQLLRANLES